MKANEILESDGYLAVEELLDYTVERRPGSWFWKRWQVRPARATGVIFTGGYWTCLRLRQDLITATRNGAWVALSDPQDRK